MVELGLAVADKRGDGFGEKAKEVPMSITLSGVAVYAYTVELNLIELGLRTLS